MRTPVDVLWLVEHVAREMDVACAAAALMRRRGLSVAVRHVYLHARESMDTLAPRVVAHPFFYNTAGALATEDYVKTWPDAVHFNLAWEEIHYKAHVKIKAPADDFARRTVLHHAWGDFYREYLEGHGVPRDHVFVNGHPAYQLYRAPYRDHYLDRARLAAKHGLDPAARWVFIPDNYRWAFLGGKIKLFSKLGGDEKEMLALRDFSTASLKLLLEWCDRAASRPGVELIFRPRPAIHSRQILDFFSREVAPRAPRFRLIKDESVREWVLASDVAVSSYSTTLIEAAVAGKPAYMFEPIPLPEGLWCDWYRHAPRLKDEASFVRVVDGKEAEASDALGRWAESELLGRGDPIRGLADRLEALARAAAPGAGGKGLASAWERVRRFFSRPKAYFNAETHEMDAFSVPDAESRIRAWESLLNAEVKA